MTSSSEVTLSIDNMSCGHCVAAVRDALEKAPGVEVSDVQLGSATVRIDPAESSPAAAAAAVEAAGYPARVA